LLKSLLKSFSLGICHVEVAWVAIVAVEVAVHVIDDRGKNV